jgi:hypothetical protein
MSKSYQCKNASEVPTSLGHGRAYYQENGAKSGKNKSATMTAGCAVERQARINLE